MWFSDDSSLSSSSHSGYDSQVSRFLGGGRVQKQKFCGIEIKRWGVEAGGKENHSKFQLIPGPIRSACTHSNSVITDLLLMRNGSYKQSSGSKQGHEVDKFKNIPAALSKNLSVNESLCRHLVSRQFFSFYGNSFRCSGNEFLKKEKIRRIEHMIVHINTESVRVTKEQLRGTNHIQLTDYASRS